MEDNDQTDDKPVTPPAGVPDGDSGAYAPDPVFPPYPKQSGKRPKPPEATQLYADPDNSQVQPVGVPPAIAASQNSDNGVADDATLTPQDTATQAPEQPLSPDVADDSADRDEDAPSIFDGPDAEPRGPVEPSDPVNPAAPIPATAALSASIKDGNYHARHGRPFLVSRSAGDSRVLIVTFGYVPSDDDIKRMEDALGEGVPE